MRRSCLQAMNSYCPLQIPDMAQADKILILCSERSQGCLKNF